MLLDEWKNDSYFWEKESYLKLLNIKNFNEGYNSLSGIEVDNDIRSAITDYFEYYRDLALGYFAEKGLTDDHIQSVIDDVSWCEAPGDFLGKGDASQYAAFVMTQPILHNLSR